MDTLAAQQVKCMCHGSLTILRLCHAGQATKNYASTSIPALHATVLHATRSWKIRCRSRVTSRSLILLPCMSLMAASMSVRLQDSKTQHTSAQPLLARTPWAQKDASRSLCATVTLPLHHARQVWVQDSTHWSNQTKPNPRERPLILSTMISALEQRNSLNSAGQQQRVSTSMILHKQT